MAARKTRFDLNKITPTATLTPEKLLKRAQMDLMNREPFIATVMLNLKHEFSDEVPTARVNNLKVQYNPQFFMTLEPSHQMFLIAHECWHVALQHSFRRGNRTPLLWNIAGDYVINQLLYDADIPVPELALCQSKYAGMSTEELYKKLETNSVSYDMLPDEFIGSEDVSNDNQDFSNAPDPVTDIKIKEILTRATEEAQKQNKWNKIPAHVKELIKGTLNPQYSWKEQLRQFVTERTKDDYSWSRPNRRHEDIYLPSLYSESVRSLVIAVDTSGSISSAILNAFMSEIRAIHQDVRPLNTHVIAVDTVVHDTYEFNPYDTIPTDLNLTGGGGTRFNPALEYAQQHDPSCLIYLTDLYARDPVQPDYPVLWVSTSSHKTGPFGETIYIDIN